MSNFASEIRRRVLVFDGAMGTATHQHQLDLDRDYLGCENCTEILNQTRPEVVGQIHEVFLEVAERGSQMSVGSR